jgi:hypothetical protein
LRFEAYTEVNGRRWPRNVHVTLGHTEFARFELQGFDAKEKEAVPETAKENGT